MKIPRPLDNKEISNVGKVLYIYIYIYFFFLNISNNLILYIIL